MTVEGYKGKYRGCWGRGQTWRGGTGSGALSKRSLPIPLGAKARCSGMGAGLPHLLNQLRLPTVNSTLTVKVSFGIGDVIGLY